MKPILRFFFFLFFLSFSVFSQKNTETEKAYYKLYLKASENFFNLKTKQSVKQSETVLTYALQKNNNNLAAKAYNLLGLNFEQFADNKKAIYYYKQGVVCGNKAKNDSVLAWLYNNLGGIYFYNNLDINESTNFYKKSVFHSKKINDTQECLVSYINIANNLIELKKFNEAKKYLDLTTNQFDKLKDPDAEISYFAANASYYELFKKDFVNAEKFYLKSIEVGEKDALPQTQLNLSEMYKSTSMFYENFKKTDKAYFYLKKHDSLQILLFDEKKESVLKGEDSSIQLGMINKRIQEVEDENKNYQKLLKYNKYFIGFLTFLIVTFLTLLYFLYKNYKKNIKINTKLKKANIELHKQKQKTEEVAKLKSQFMSTVSHELRTPLYGVIGMTEIIENEHLELKDSKYLSSLKFSAKYLLSLINDVLSLSKIESEKIDLIFENINFRKEIEIIVTSLEVIANQYHNKITIDFDNAIPQFIKTDKTRLSQILINLISNALKFTKNGSVHIHVFVNASYKKLNFEIIDTGIGIPKKYIDKIFDKFIQVERNSDEQFQGTGLGLAIVKRFVDLFKGEISIESEVNVGTTIRFYIPLFIGEEIMEIEHKNTNYSIENLRVLVVEDNKVNQIVTQKLLEKNNLKCTIAFDGYNAIEILKENKFDVILMDIHMPGINGFETTAQIHKLGITTPIIALTASDKYELEGEITKYNMKDILVKPFEFSDLQRIIEKQLR